MEEGEGGGGLRGRGDDVTDLLGSDQTGHRARVPLSLRIGFGLEVPGGSILAYRRMRTLIHSCPTFDFSNSWIQDPHCGA